GILVRRIGAEVQVGSGHGADGHDLDPDRHASGCGVDGLCVDGRRQCRKRNACDEKSAPFRTVGPWSNVGQAHRAYTTAHKITNWGGANAVKQRIAVLLMFGMVPWGGLHA